MQTQQFFIQLHKNNTHTFNIVNQTETTLKLEDARISNFSKIKADVKHLNNKQSKSEMLKKITSHVLVKIIRAFNLLFMNIN